MPPANDCPGEDALTRILLEQSDGARLLSGWMPPFGAVPEVVTWNGRIFRFRERQLMDPSGEPSQPYSARPSATALVYREFESAYAIPPDFWRNPS
jgi:hypothetical protein